MTVIDVQEALRQGYSTAPPQPADDDLPTLLVGHDQVKKFASEIGRKVDELVGENRRLATATEDMKTDMEAIRGLIADALNEWASGNDEAARTALRNAAARAGGH